jgi:hypothetical protein
MNPRAVTIRRGTSDRLTQHVLATTPGNQPNVYVEVIAPVLAVAIRAARAFYAAFAGVFLASIAGVDQFEAATVGGALKAAALTGVMAGIVSAVTNTGEILARIDQKFPIMRA